MKVNKKQDNKHKLNVITYAKEIGNVKRLAGFLVYPDPSSMCQLKGMNYTVKRSI